MLDRACVWVTLALLGSGCADDQGDDWDVDDPPRVAFTDATPPRMEVPPDESMWSSAPLPMVEVGEDSGEEGIVYTAALCGYYQMRMQDTDEGFHYEYDPVMDSYNEANNVHRKAVTAFSLTWLYKFTRREEFRFSVERALEYLLDQAREQTDGTLRLSDLGATSLIIMAATQHAGFTGTTAWDEQIDKLGGHVLGLIDDNGRFTESGPLQFAQAHLALWRLFDYTQDVAYLDALENVARFFYDNRADDEYIPSRHLYGLWAHEPLAELYEQRPADWMAQLVYEMADAVVAGQFTPLDDVPPEWVGGFRESETEPTWRTILKLEGTIDAYRMAIRHGDEERAFQYRRSALIATTFLQNLQFRAGDTDDHPMPNLAVGGTPFGFDDPIVRIEVPGHMVNAVLKVVEYMDLEDYPGR